MKTPITYGSVCSGIEAATVAWHPLDWTPAWFSQFDPEHDYSKGRIDLPSAVLAHHYPNVKNHGDMLKLAPMVRAREIEAPDVLVGGTPCQSFSIAGLRKSMGDSRGQLTLAYVELLNAIDDVRRADGEPECIAVWENVPGCLNTSDNAFGCFLGALAGEDEALQPAGKRWAYAGCVYGPERTIAWRVLDAQYFGVAQRRRRIIVVATARKDIDPSEILFEFDSVRLDSPPRREKGEGFTHDAAPSLTASGRGVERGGDSRGQDPVIAVFDRQSSGEYGTAAAIAYAIQERAICENPVAGPDGIGIKTDDTAYTMEARTVPQAVAYPLDLRNALRDPEKLDVQNRQGCGIGADGDPVSTLSTAHVHGVALSVALRGREGGATAELGDDQAGTQRASAGGGDKAHVLTAMAFGENQRGEVLESEINRTLQTGGGKPGQGYPAERQGMVVRRLIPRECERLQGFEPDYTLIPLPLTSRQSRVRWAADGPRYKSLGNSMCVTKMRWIGQRIDSAIRGKNG